jgi:hypothetical protein
MPLTGFISFVGSKSSGDIGWAALKAAAANSLSLKWFGKPVPLFRKYFAEPYESSQVTSRLYQYWLF